MTIVTTQIVPDNPNIKFIGGTGNNFTGKMQFNYFFTVPEDIGKRLVATNEYGARVITEVEKKKFVQEWRGL